MKALNEKLGVGMQSTGRLLSFERSIPSIKSAEDSSFASCVAAKAILARVRPVVVIAMWAVRTHSHAEQMLIRKKHHDSKTFHACKRIFGNQSSSRVIARHLIFQVLWRQRQEFL